MTEWTALARLDADDLRSTGSFKWTTFPGAMGAFIAEMDFPLADPVRVALHEAIDHDSLGYLPLPLEQRLRDSCANWMSDNYGWSVESEAVVIVPDVLRGLELILDAFVEPGAPVVLPTPAYAPFLHIPPGRGHDVVQVPMVLDEDGVWRLNEAAVEAALAERPSLLVLCNPHNPLGRVMDRDELVRIAAIAERTGAKVFADEIHAPLVYAPHHHVPYASVSAAAAAHSFTALSASKAWNLPGLKCAQMILTNPADRDRWTTLGYFASRGASNLGVLANAVAFADGRDWLNEALEYLRGNRDLVADLVDRLLPGARYVTPQGTYLAWIDVRALTDERDLAPFLREHAGVAITGGEECGAAGVGFIRVNLAMPRHLLVEVMQRIATALVPSALVAQAAGGS